MSDISDKKEPIYILPVRDLVIFPGVVFSIMIGRQKSINFLLDKKNLDNKVFVVSQKNMSNDEINKNNLYDTGVVCKILQEADGPDGQKRIVVEGLEKAKLVNLIEDKRYYIGEIEAIQINKYTALKNKKIVDLRKIFISKIKEYLEYNGKYNENIPMTLDFFKTIDEVIFYAISIIAIPLEIRQAILEENDDYYKLKQAIEAIDSELMLDKIDKKINNNVEKKFLKIQKRAFLNEKVRLIKKELGDDFDEKNDNNEVLFLKKKIAKTALSEDAKIKCKEELKKLDGMLPYSGEYQVIKNYLELVLSLPWNVFSPIDHDLDKAEAILNRDHYGLNEVKERIIEFLAVYKRKKTLSGQIICLVGAPGVGKTSLAKSIAEALNRKYVKVSLGGVKDEAEIRGHRRTYIGSLPGKIISSLKKVGTSNPLILLDEIDKLGSDYKGDPANALLEVLDPEQNNKFEDHYLEIEFNLSNVMFIATANNMANIPIPLRDRMEIIRLSGYTEDEKLKIAENYLIPKEMDNHGILKKEFSINEKGILEIIRKYTFEAGVRNLEREIAKLIRKSIKLITTNNKIKKIHIDSKNLKDFLGVEKFDFNKIWSKDRVGVAVGLAYTDFGGDLLNIESLKFSGSGKLITTGKLGDVMKESAQASFSYVRSIASHFGIQAKEFNKYDFHLHVPEGATPKDGPSAGVAISSSLLSSMTGKKINRDVAMTGEISLTGQVMPIGGLKEKLLAALRGNIKTVVIPEGNKKNLVDIPDNVKENLKIIPVENLEDAFKIVIKGYK